jgi:hypothetical protein
MSNNQASTTRMVKAVMSSYADQITSVTTRHVMVGDCRQQTIVMLNATGWENGEHIHTFAVGAFPEAKVTLSPAGFLSISWPHVTAEMLAEADEMNRADDNATRFYLAARRVDLRRWLSPTYYLMSTPNDPWTKARRIRQMQARLAVLDAEVCTRVACDRFWPGDDQPEDVAAHVAEHLRLLRQESEAVTPPSSSGQHIHP